MDLNNLRVTFDSKLALFKATIIKKPNLVLVPPTYVFVRTKVKHK